ncbi:MAG: hypothetical protein CVV27_12345 [Candidatus Melainabacteria bacterium HGW-Melainabacteria-1]|nr:MAG: hypothetical protein CVV27_12345 [Candidatus Melainabacteria bacterium HGW-Melainabacteria-1]
MESTIQSNPSTGIDQVSRPRDVEREQLDQLILGGPALVNPVQSANKPEDDGLRPEDRFERIDTDAALAAMPVQSVKAPEVGAPVVRAEEDVVLPVDGRGPAVAIQDHLAALRQQGDNNQFAATAKALGVGDVNEFERLVERGDALQTFAAVDSNRLLFSDSNFNQINVDQISAVAKAQMVIKPSYEVPIDPEITAPEIALINPHQKLKESLELPVSPTEQLKNKLTDPQQILANNVVTG